MKFVVSFKTCSAMWWTVVMYLVVSKLTRLPKSFDKSFHLLCFSLNTDVSLELSQGFVKFHAREIHLVHHAAIKRQTIRLGSVVVSHRNDNKSECIEMCMCVNVEHTLCKCWWQNLPLTVILPLHNRWPGRCAWIRVCICAHIPHNISGEERVWRQIEIWGNEEGRWAWQSNDIQKGDEGEVFERLRAGCGNSSMQHAHLCVCAHLWPCKCVCMP